MSGKVLGSEFTCEYIAEDDSCKLVDALVQHNSELCANYDKCIDALGAENARLRELCETLGMIANGSIGDYYERDEMLEQANATARELGVEL